MLEITLITTVIILIIRFPSMAELVRTGIVRSDEAARIGDKPSLHIIIIIILVIIIIIVIGDKLAFKSSLSSSLGSMPPYAPFS